MTYAKILPKLLVGSHPHDANDVEVLVQIHVTAVLNLQTDDDMSRLGIVWNCLRACYEASNIESSRIPVRDFDVEDLEAKLPECVRKLSRMIDGGHTVYLHCTAGAGRSPSTAIAYLIWGCGWDVDRAAEYVRSRRECSPPIEAIVRAFSRDKT